MKHIKPLKMIWTIVLNMMYLGVNLQCLNDGSGIANTLLTNNASYHNRCWGRFRSHIEQRAKAKRTKLFLVLMRVSTATLFNVSAVRSFKMTAKSKSTELGVKTVARSCGIQEFMHDWTLHSMQRMQRLEICIITHLVIHSTRMMPVLQNRSLLMLRGSSVGCSYDPFGNIAQLVAFVEFNHSLQACWLEEALWLSSQSTGLWLDRSLRAPEKIQRKYIREARTGLVRILRWSWCLRLS